MSSSLVPVLHHEERAIVAELRASKPFQRLEAIRRLLALYDAQPSVATGLDVPVSGEADRGAAVINFAATAPQPQPQPVYAPPPMTTQSAPVAAIPLPGPAAVAAAAPPPSTQVAAIAQAAVADVVMRSPAPVASPQAVEPDSSSVVSSVRAALLGIGKG